MIEIRNSSPNALYSMTIVALLLTSISRIGCMSNHFAAQHDVFILLFEGRTPKPSEPTLAHSVRMMAIRWVWAPLTHMWG